jgi:hypothetical protein
MLRRAILADLAWQKQAASLWRAECFCTRCTMSGLGCDPYSVSRGILHPAAVT